MASFFDARLFREASQLNGFSGNRIERFSEGRDETSLATARAASGAGYYLFCDDKALVQVMGEERAPLFTAAAAECAGLIAESVILLGVTSDGPRFAGLVANEPTPASGVERVDLRTLAVGDILQAGELAALAQARSYLFWHAGNRYCGRCGGPLGAIRGGAGRACFACAAEYFPRVDPVVIMLAVDGERCLLGRQPRFAPGIYSALAGFLEPGETIEEAVRREIKEEAGILTGRVAYHSSQVWPFPSSLMIGCHAEALSTDVERDAAELEDCRWFAREEVRLMLGGTHPQGLAVPAKMAIAYHLIRTFSEWSE